MLVHLPIGFIVLAVVLELTGQLLKKSAEFRMPVIISLIFGVLAGLMSIASGWLLSSSGDYSTEVLNQHKWLAIGTIALTFVFAIAKWQMKRTTIIQSITGAVVLMGLLSAAGHIGGVLTHGATYLSEYAPTPIQKLMGGKPRKEVLLLPVSDSVIIYRDIIAPMMRQKCMSCHNQEKTSGGLNMMGFQNLFKQSESGRGIVAGNIWASQIYKRVTLPNQSEKFMPTKGTPLNHGEVAVLAYWIEQGADSLAQFEVEKLDEPMQRLLKRDYGLDYSPKPYYEKMALAAPDSATLHKLKSLDFDVKTLSQTNFLLDVRFVGKHFTADHASALAEVQSNITWLDLSEANVTDRHKLVFNKFIHLTKLDLHSNTLSDAGIESLATLQHLEILNLYNTSITDESIRVLSEMPALKKLYVWQTAITAQGQSKLKAYNANLTIIGESS